MAGKSIEQEELAGIQYHGLAGITGECLDSIKRFIHFGDTIHEAKLLTCRDGDSIHHAFILTVNFDEIIAVKSGFSSGYRGTGAEGLAVALQILIRHSVNIDEFEIKSEVIERINTSCLLVTDLENLKNLNPIRPQRYTDYIVDLKPNTLPRLYDNKELRAEFPASIPFGILDARLIDLAIDFFNDPDACLLKAFKRLEGIVKKRTGIKAKSGAKLFSEVFLNEDSVLYWEDEDRGEHVAKANMFSAIFGTYRNPRAHQEKLSNDRDCLKELLLINELYYLEGIAVERAS